MEARATHLPERSRSQEAPDQASGDRLHFAGLIGNPEVTEPGALDWKDYHWMYRKTTECIVFCRTQSLKIPVHDRRETTLKADSDMKKYVVSGVKLIPDLVTKVEEHLKRTSFGK